ncbi:MAG: hypothetical protein Q9182_003646 [Xanthomendoza sp. 2 TL-2023]
MSDPSDPLNQAFRHHFSKRDSTLGSLLSILNKPLLEFLRSLLVHQTYGNAELDPIIVEILGAQCGTLTRFLQIDTIDLIPSESVRRFLKKCLDRPICALDLTELQRPTTVTGNDPLQHVDQAIEQNIQANFRVRFAKLAWYRSYKQSVMVQGQAFPASYNNISALLPQLDSIRFNVFANGIAPNPSNEMRERMYKLVLAGYRYDFLCRDVRTFPHGTSNDGHLFLLPDTISAHQWEHDMLEIELQQTRKYLRGLGLRRIARSFPGLDDLARVIIDHYMNSIKPKVTTPPFPLSTTMPLIEQQDHATPIAGPSRPFPPSQDGMPSLSQYGPASSKISMMATLANQQYYLPKPEPDPQQGAEYFQQPNAITQSNQRQTPINAKRCRSPVPIVPLPILTVASSQEMSCLEIERPLKSPRLMTHSTITPVISGRNQQNGVSYNQHQQPWQQAPIGTPIQNQQQFQAGTSTFAFNIHPLSVQEQQEFLQKQETVQQLQQQQTEQPHFTQQVVQGFPLLKTEPSGSTQTGLWIEASPPSYRHAEQQQREVCEHVPHLDTDQIFSTPKPQKIASVRSASWPQALPEPTGNFQQQGQEHTHSQILSIPETKQEIQTQQGLWPQSAPPSLKNTAQQPYESTPLMQDEPAILVSDISQNGSITCGSTWLQTHSTSTNDTAQQSSAEGIANDNQSRSITSPPSEQPTTATHPPIKLEQQSESNPTPKNPNDHIEETNPPHPVESTPTTGSPSALGIKQETHDTPQQSSHFISTITPNPSDPSTSQTLGEWPASPRSESLDGESGAGLQDEGCEGDTGDDGDETSEDEGGTDDSTDDDDVEDEHLMACG